MAENENEEGARPRTGGEVSGTLTTLVIFNTVIILGVAYFQFTLHQKQVLTPSIKDVVEANLVDQGDEVNLEGKAQEEDGILLQLNKFTANLAHGEKGVPRYIRLNIVLKFDRNSKEEEFKARRPQIRDVIINILNTKRKEELLRPDGKDYLKNEIKSSINAFLLNGKVIDLFYIGFQIS